VIVKVFPIRFDGIGRVVLLPGIRRESSCVEVDHFEVRVRMGWAFRLAVPRTSVHSAAESNRGQWAWGAHGWRGSWLVNGSSRGIVRFEVDPPAWARVLGGRFELRTIGVSVEDPEALVRELNRDDV
jgi:hypothetical protein